MAKVVLRVYYDAVLMGRHEKMASAKGYRGFTWIPPERRKATAMHKCPVGGELTKDYWYCHDTGKQGDTKLCNAHEVEIVYAPNADRGQP